MQNIYRVMARLMATDLTVMIFGESGTGKELVARALHDYGKRRRGPFVAVNMAAIPRELIESELFGHEKGAFTGAVTRGVGRFEQAAGGTLFLDEIGDMPLDAQTRLLRVLQQGEFTTVGGRIPIKADVRIIAATHRDLRQAIRQGQFREDLFYRLNVVPIRLPAAARAQRGYRRAGAPFPDRGGAGRGGRQDPGRRRAAAAARAQLAGQCPRARESDAPDRRALRPERHRRRYHRDRAGRRLAPGGGGGPAPERIPLGGDRAPSAAVFHRPSARSAVQRAL